MKKLLVICGALLSFSLYSLTVPFESSLREKYAFQNVQYFLLKNGTVWEVLLDGNLQTPYTNYVPSNWYLKDALTVQTADVIALPNNQYPYLMYNRATDEYAYARRISLAKFIDYAYNEGYAKGQGDAGIATLWISHSDRRTITLNNGIRFEIDFMDRDRIQAWLPNHRVVVSESGKYFSPVLLTNLDTNSSVKAKRL